MKGNPAAPVGLLTSKPTWLGTPGCLATSVLLLVARPQPAATKLMNPVLRHIVYEVRE